MASSDDGGGTVRSLETLNFVNTYTKDVPVDDGPNEPRQVPGAVFARVKPTQVENPVLVASSASALALLDLPPSEADRDDFAAYISYNKPLPGSDPVGHCYCGHQFGYFSGQLGDGAAILLGEVHNAAGERWQMQIKGCGPTPFSRGNDGRKVLRSSVREFLCSEAMHALGIPTTRAGALITSDTHVVRDKFYDGNAEEERASVVLRLSPTFIRFGSFEIFKGEDEDTGRAGPSHGNTKLRDQLMDRVAQYYPHITAEHGTANTPGRNLALYKEIVRRTARLVASWQCVGFCHGVLNTDNMSILGDTIDYGPFGFMDRFDPGFICNASDNEGRYTYENQPSMCRWNCQRLFDMFQPCLPDDAEVEALLKQHFDAEFEDAHLSGMRRKLGLRTAEEGDKALVEALLSAMAASGADFTTTFRNLSAVPFPASVAPAAGTSDDGDGDGKVGEESKASSDVLDAASAAFVEDLLAQLPSPEDIAQTCTPTIPAGQLSAIAQDLMMNPMSRFRHMAPRIMREITLTNKYNTIMSRSSAAKRKEDKRLWTAWIRQYRARLASELATLSASAASSKGAAATATTDAAGAGAGAGAGAVDAAHAAKSVQALAAERTELMRTTNPRVVLRNHVAEAAIQTAEAGDYSGVRALLHMLQHPFDDEVEVPAELCSDKFLVNTFQSKPIAAEDLQLKVT